MDELSCKECYAGAPVSCDQVEQPILKSDFSHDTTRGFMDTAYCDHTNGFLRSLGNARAALQRAAQQVEVFAVCDQLRAMGCAILHHCTPVLPTYQTGPRGTHHVAPTTGMAHAVTAKRNSRNWSNRGRPDANGASSGASTVPMAIYFIELKPITLPSVSWHKRTQPNSPIENFDLITVPPAGAMRSS